MRRLILLAAIALADVPARHQGQGDPLRLLTKCTLSVSIVSGRDVGLIDTDRIRATVENRLRALGIRVLADQELAKESENIPAFEVRATTLALTSSAGERIGTTFYLDLSLIEWTTLSRTRATVPAVLWTDGHLQAVGAEPLSAVLERDLNNELNKFAIALKNANQ